MFDFFINNFFFDVYKKWLMMHQLDIIKTLRLQKKACEGYQNLSVEEYKWWQYICKRFKNLSEYEKKVLLNIEKIILECGKTLHDNQVT